MTDMHVHRPGMLSVLQDAGRFGHQLSGVSVNGPMDEWSHRVANALVGNDERAAVLECTLNGPHVSFSENTMVALCGARMQASVDGRPVPFDRAVMIRRGAMLQIGKRIAGARLYLAVRGGFVPEPVLGSRSTNLSAGFGGFHGRALKGGDKLPVGTIGASGKSGASDSAFSSLPIERRLVQSGLPLVAARRVELATPRSPDDPLCFVRGPHWHAFVDDAHTALQAQAYRVSSQSDRMGVRLQGPALALTAPLELISEATAFGTIQVPPDGQPIVLMADRQSAGGYPKIGYVASADLPRLAQALPGDAIRFAATTQADAETAWRRFEDHLSAIRTACAAALLD